MLHVRAVDFRDSDAQALVAEVQAEYVVRYGSPDEAPMDERAFDAGSGGFLVGYLGDVPVAMGGWRFRPDVPRLGGACSAELKRMYVAPAGRRQGLARLVLARLEAGAGLAGADTMILETGAAQPEAIALYESSGYVPVAKFGHYAASPLSRCFGKRLR